MTDGKTEGDNGGGARGNGANSPHGGAGDRTRERIGLGPEGSDQTASDADQITSDADQAASDADQTAADQDQAQSESDDASSERDQAAADREIAAGGESASEMAAHAKSRAERQQGTAERAHTRQIRNLTTVQRVESAAQRDAAASLRDAYADSRDELAAARDLESKDFELTVGNGPRASAAIRERAAADRECAADDRAHAAHQREQAAEERRDVYSELEESHLDDLTGLLRRRAGCLALENEMERAQRTDGLLVLAFIDVDGLKAVNDELGHAAGDVVLQGLANVLLSNLRPYEPSVRIGGDEFVCAMVGADLDTATRRFTEIQRKFQEEGSASMSFGLALLGAGDTLEDLINRGDAALLAARRKRGVAPSER